MSRLENLRQSKGAQPLVVTRTEREKERPSLRGWIILSIIILLFAALVYLLFFSKIFNIQQVRVEGYEHPEKITELVDEQRGRGYFSGNIILFSKKVLKDTLAGDPLVADIDIRKIFPNKLIVNVQESKPALIWVTEGDKYLLDERGAILGTRENEELPTVYDSADIKVERGDRVASPTFIKFIRALADGFEPATGTRPSKIIIFDLLTDIHVLSSDGWTVYLDATRDPEAELKNLSRVLTEARKETGRKLEYIDLRLDTKAYYK